MKEKRAEILESAIKFFSEKGYFYTSMQDIASDCGISKGSLYKIVDSKEDLLIQLFEYNHEKMFQKGSAIHLDHSLSRKEMLKKLIVVELEGALENKNFFNIIYTSLPGSESEKTIALLKKTRAEMVNWHKHTLQRIYGQEVEKGIWDLVITFQGIIKEFIFLINKEDKQVDFEEAAAYIADLLDTVVQHLPVWRPVLSAEQMAEYEELQAEKRALTYKEKQSAALEALKTVIETESFNHRKKQDLLASANMLEEELKQEQPRSFLIDALLGYLDEEEKLKKEIKRISSLFR